MARCTLALLLIAGGVMLAGCGQEDASPSGPDGSGTQGAIAVRSTPECAAIFLDGISTGLVTPDTLRAIAVGAHEVRVERAGSGGIGATASVTVNGDATADVDLTLSDPASSGFISVSSDLVGMEILIDGLPTCLTTPATASGISVGSHEVTVGRLGFAATPTSMMVSVTAGGTASASFSVAPIMATSRTALLEHFTSWQCVPCQPAEDVFDTVTDSLSRDQVAIIAYHDVSTTDDDPYFLANPVDANIRVDYYHVLANPLAFIDGQPFSPPFLNWGHPGAFPTLRDSVLAHNAVTPEFTVTVEARIVGGMYFIDAAVTSHTDHSAGGVVVRVAVVEKEIVPTDVQPLGQTHYSWVMRDLVPDGAGQAIAPGSGETIDISRQVAISSAWHMDEIGAVVFVQKTDGSRVVLQSGNTF